MSIAAFSIVALAILITSFISGILGMAGGMILMGILLALMPVASAMMLHGVTQMASNGWRAWLWRKEIDWRIFRGNAYGAFIVVAVFCALQMSLSRPVVYVILGITPFISYLLPKDLRLNVDRPGHPFICGLICNSLQLLSGVAGPMLDVFFLQSKMDRRGVVATKAAAQTLSHLLKILYFGLLLGQSQGRVEWWMAVVMVAIAMLGTNLSRSVLDRMTDINFRRWTRWTVTVIGTVYLGTGILALVRP